MKKIVLCLAILLSFLQISYSQYSADWGKYMNESIPNADFSVEDEPEQLAVDVRNAATNDEYVYVTGRTNARSDHESSCPQNKFYYGAEDDFLAKYDKCGNLQWFRFLGTDNDNVNDECGDFGDCIAIDHDPVTDSSFIYIGGYSYSNYDPLSCSSCLPCGSTNSAKASSCKGDTCVFQKSKRTAIDAFVAKYDENGNLVKWTYFGGDGDDNIIGISIFKHDVFITGTTSSNPDFIPAATPKFDSTLSTQSDAFVAQLDNELCHVKFFSYMGGPEYERTHSIQCFKSPGIPTQFYVSGATSGEIGDTSYHPLNSYKGGLDDSFLSLWKLDKAAGVYKPQWMKYIGGKGDDRDREMITDKDHNAIVTGFTYSKNFISGSTWSYPKSNFYDTTLSGTKDAFIAKFDTAGNALWGTFYGGNESDEARGLVRYTVTSGTTTNYIAISGGTKSNDLPVQPLHPPFEAILNGGGSPASRDAFVAIVTDPQASTQAQQLEFSSYFGGKKNEWDDAITDYGPDLDIGGNKELYLTFYTRSTNIENCISSTGYHHNTNSGNDNDGFLAKILNNTISKQFDCTSYNWGTNNPDKNSAINIPENKMVLYPNPSSGIFTLQLKLNAAMDAEGIIELLNVYGQKVYSGRLSVMGGELNEEISTGDLRLQGIYFVKLKVRNSLYVEQIAFQP